ncbi:saccharopine dehydrogenase-like oxidoreductase [Anaeramoeba flamelloides]|uniref:Saccharopine dehydrogenase-like oxidoreductase n=1 Tax=Anaeramoeba flamelloides TaxID=1746091 RepID=A0AAV7ZJZ2_9EUKA|nr:saccharopine dehydrogenase-like oxidoreductase [Anaeramoeba flamelloides]KAJ6248055.1 saccharopine dehydrogenase-like oxidoreductase [Anaeramoeba flamelloides]
MTSREFDFIVFGTGYTGSILARHLAKQGLNYKWTIAGRNREKCKNLVRELTEISNKTFKAKPILANVEKPETIQEMCKKTNVIINCVGPFSKFGEVVIKACIENKTHYCDINGEPQFINKIFVKYHDKAIENNVIITLSAGFDSVPADLGVQLIKKQIGAGKVLKIGGFFEFSQIQMSNGTYRTLINSYNPSKQERKETREMRELAKEKDLPKIEYLDTKINKKPKGYTTKVSTISKNKEGMGGFVMKFSVADPTIVKKTQLLQDATQKIPSFRYEHYLMVRGWFAILLTFLKFFFIRLLANWAWGKKVLRLFESDIGGPSENDKKNAVFVATFVGTDQEGKKIKYSLSGPDGYTSTAIFIKHTCFSLLEDYDDLDMKCGVITPGCLGQVYFDRILNDKTFEWKNAEEKKKK